MFERQITPELLKLSTQYPVVTLIGPRQSGKTTLAKYLFPNKAYINLEAPDHKQFAMSDPRAFLNRYPEGAILDEIQNVPELSSYIQEIVDVRQQKGQFILTGSHQLSLHAAITQSLAGRTALLSLLPLSMKELSSAHIELDLDHLLLAGGFPRIFNDHLEAFTAHRNYMQTYLERDVRQLIHLRDLHLFQQFLKLCAGRVGQIINYQNLSNELGVSAQTVKHWLSILEASFIIFQLPPYFENFGKRLLKSPKLYFTDVGLATYLLGIESVTQMQRDPLRGALVENLCILELMKQSYNQGRDAELYYFRDSMQHEVDVILKSGHELIPIEIKAAQTFNAHFLSGLEYFKKLVGERCPTGYLVYAGTQQQSIGQWEVIRYDAIGKVANVKSND